MFAERKEFDDLCDDTEALEVRSELWFEEDDGFGVLYGLDG